MPQNLEDKVTEIFEKMKTDKIALNESPPGDDDRSRALNRLGGVFNIEFKALWDAIRLLAAEHDRVGNAG